MENTGSAICLMAAADHNYLHPALVFLTSFFHNHRKEKVEVFFLESGLSQEERMLFYHLAECFPEKQIHMIEITEEQLQGLQSFGRFSVAAFYRILGMERVPDWVSRLLYLDVDMVVNRNLSTLFQMELEHPLAACYDINNKLQGNIEYHKELLQIPEKEGYFNSGFLLLDMDFIRSRSVKEQLFVDIMENNERYQLKDQDALNKYFMGNIQWLPWQIYNCPCVPYLVQYADQCRIPVEESDLLSYRSLEQGDACCYDMTNQIIQNAAVIHYCTEQKPWKDREFYRQDNMVAAGQVYDRYEKLLKRLLRHS